MGIIRSMITAGIVHWFNASQHGELRPLFGAVDDGYACIAIGGDQQKVQVREEIAHAAVKKAVNNQVPGVVLCRTQSFFDELQEEYGDHSDVLFAGRNVKYNPFSSIPDQELPDPVSAALNCVSEGDRIHAGRILTYLQHLFRDYLGSGYCSYVNLKTFSELLWQTSVSAFENEAGRILSRQIDYGMVTALNAIWQSVPYYNNFWNILCGRIERFRQCEGEDYSIYEAVGQNKLFVFHIPDGDSTTVGIILGELMRYAAGGGAVSLISEGVPLGMGENSAPISDRLLSSLTSEQLPYVCIVSPTLSGINTDISVLMRMQPIFVVLGVNGGDAQKLSEAYNAVYQGLSAGVVFGKHAVAPAPVAAIPPVQPNSLTAVALRLPRSAVILTPSAHIHCSNLII